MLHQTFLVVVAYVVFALVEPMPVQYVLIVVLSAAATFGAYELARRVPPLRFLLGIKSAAPAPGSAGNHSVVTADFTILETTQ